MITTSNKIKTNYTWGVVLLVSYNLIANLANDLYLPSMPAIVKFFSITPNTVQLTIVAWFVGIALPQLIFGPLSDQFGRRPILFVGGLCFAIASFVCMLADNVWVLMVARLFQGIGVSSANVTCYTIITELYKLKKRIKILIYLNVCASLSPLIGSSLGGGILSYYGWRANFALIALLLVVVLLALWFQLPESNVNKNIHKLNIKQIMLNYKSLLAQRPFVGYLLTYCFIVGGLISYLAAAPFIIIDKFKLSPEYFGLVQAFVFVPYVIGSMYLVAHGVKYIKVYYLIILGLVFIFISSLLMVVTSYLYSDYLLVFILPMFFYTLGFSFCGSLLINKVMSYAMNVKGYSAALLGLLMASCGVVSSVLTAVLYNEKIITVAAIILLMSLLACICYYIADNK